MRYVIWTFRIVILLLVAGFLFYTLPRHDVVRVVDTEVRLQDTGGWNSIFWATSEPQTTESRGRDVKFISTVLESGRTRVFRNEDTGWGWPPYFKFDSADVQARASDLERVGPEASWALVRYYGVRVQLLSIFPNAVDVRSVEGPDHRVIPLFNIIFLTGLGIMVLLVWRWWRRFRRNRIDPIVRDVQEAFEPDDEDKKEPERPNRGAR